MDMTDLPVYDGEMSEAEIFKRDCAFFEKLIKGETQGKMDVEPDSDQAVAGDSEPENDVDGEDDDDEEECDEMEVENEAENDAENEVDETPIVQVEHVEIYREIRKIKIDLEGARAFLSSQEAMQTCVSSDKFKAHFSDKTYGEVLRQYINLVETDPSDPAVGWVTVEYRMSEIGQFLYDIGILNETRLYSRHCPFSLPGKLNSILTGKFYRQWDCRAAQFAHASEVVCAGDDDAKSAFEAMLTDVCGWRRRCAAFYFEKTDDESISRVKAAAISLMFGKSLGAVEYDFGKSGCPEMTQLARAIEHARTKILMSTRASMAVGMIAEKFPVKKDGSSRDAGDTFVSYYLQSLEARARAVKEKVITSLGGVCGPIQHDCCTELIRPDMLDATEMKQKLDAALRDAKMSIAGVKLEIPVEIKVTPVEFSLKSRGLDLFNPRMLSPIREDEHALMRLLNRYFAWITLGVPMVAQISYHAGTDDVARVDVLRQRDAVHKFYDNVNINGKSMRVLDWWLAQECRKMASQILFDPTRALRDDSIINTYTGLPFQYNHPVQPDMDLVQPVLDHILHVLANGIQKDAEYIINWLACALQTKRKTGTMLFFHGAMGSGKDVISKLLYKIYGEYSTKFTSIERLFSRFNGISERCLMAVLDEVAPYDHKRKNGEFKDLITSERVQVEKKGLEMEDRIDYRNFLATSNDANAFRIEEGDRRIVMFTVSDKYSRTAYERGDISENQRLDYFSKVLGNRTGQLRKASDDEITMVAAHFYVYLMQIDISKFNAVDIVVTDAREEQIENHADPFVNFLESWRGACLPSIISFDDFVMNELRTPSNAAKTEMTLEMIWKLYSAYLQVVDPSHSRFVSSRTIATSISRANGKYNKHFTETRRSPNGRIAWFTLKL